MWMNPLDGHCSGKEKLFNVYSFHPKYESITGDLTQKSRCDLEKFNGCGAHLLLLELFNMCSKCIALIMYISRLGYEEEE